MPAGPCELCPCPCSIHGPPGSPPPPPACPHPYPKWSAPASTCPVLPQPPNLLKSSLVFKLSSKSTSSLPPLPFSSGSHSVLCGFSPLLHSCGPLTCLPLISCLGSLASPTLGPPLQPGAQSQDRSTRHLSYFLSPTMAGSLCHSCHIYKMGVILVPPLDSTTRRKR